MMDALIRSFDRGVKSVLGGTPARRPCPQAESMSMTLDTEERSRSIALMRVNHAGEVAAQALYQGQALFARDPDLQKRLQHAADEELDHLAWTRQRVEALGGRTSLLDPAWYAGAFAIGALAGLLGDKVSLGFLQATEEQVEAHLDSHLDQLPQADHASRAIVAQMKRDEAGHAQTARELGSESLPWLAREAMRASAKVMTTLAARI
jgi:Ubiquinone biosynthesis protein COQ7